MDVDILAVDVGALADALAAWFLPEAQEDSDPPEQQQLQTWVQCVDVRMLPPVAAQGVPVQCAVCAEGFRADEDAYCCGPCLRTQTGVAAWFHPICWKRLCDPTCCKCGGYLTE